MKAVPYINGRSHRICKYYFSEGYTNFLLINASAENTITINSEDFHHLIVVLKGELLVEYDEFINNVFGAEEIIFIPSYSKSKIKATKESKVLIGTFELPDDICTTRTMDELGNLRSAIEYKFESIKVNAPMKQFLDLLQMYLESGVQCAHLYEIKEKEIMLMLRWFYTDEDFVKLFYPIIGKFLSFRAMVVKNYSKVKDIQELAQIAGMGRSKFDAKFKEAFGMPPKQWILKRKARSIKYFMSKPGVTICDVMAQFQFDSFTHFNRFCKQQFGVSPSELIKQKDIDNIQYDVVVNKPA